MTDAELVATLKARLANPAVPDSELLIYINLAKTDVSPAKYSAVVYDAQLIDTAVVYLIDDNKFPEITGVNQGGVNTSFASNDPMRIKDRIAGRRVAAWMGGA